MQREVDLKSQNIIWKRLVRMTLKGNRSLLQAPGCTNDTRTTTDANAKVDKDAQKVIDDGKTLGQINTDFNSKGDTIRRFVGPNKVKPLCPRWRPRNF